jgi:signal transduction histidine kinase
VEWNGGAACLASLRDITDRKRAEESARELIRSEAANLAKNDLIAVISHDLRTPLNAIIGYTELIEMGIGADPAQRGRDFVRRIRTAAEHQVHLIDQLLTFSRLEAGGVELRPRAVDVADLMADVREIVEPLADQAGLALHVESVGPIPLITDPDALRQILLNLATNALKYTENGEVRLAASATSCGARIRVSDTGIGIAPAHLDRIFEPFWQAESGRRGAGLGLSIVRRLARALGGDVEVTSTLGRGTTFTVLLPSGRSPEPAPTASR